MNNREKDVLYNNLDSCFRNSLFSDGRFLTRYVTAGHEIESEMHVCALTVPKGYKTESETAFFAMDAVPYFKL